MNTLAFSTDKSDKIPVAIAAPFVAYVLKQHVYGFETYAAVIVRDSETRRVEASTTLWSRESATRWIQRQLNSLMSGVAA